MWVEGEEEEERRDFAVCKSEAVEEGCKPGPMKPMPPERVMAVADSGPENTRIGAPIMSGCVVQGYEAERALRNVSDCMRESILGCGCV